MSAGEGSGDYECTEAFSDDDVVHKMVRIICPGHFGESVFKPEAVVGKIAA